MSYLVRRQRRTARRQQHLASASGGRTRNQARLIVIEGAGRGHKVLVTGNCRVGRGRDTEVMLDADDVSRLHARIHMGESPEIEDLGSRNGTFVNDIPVEGRAPIRFGDRIRIGGSTLLLFTHYDQAEDEMMKRQRLELLGRIAAGVAHDVNNLLGALLATQTYLIDTSPNVPLGEPETRECLLEVRAAAEQAAHLMPKLLSFARGDHTGHRLFDLSAVCEEVAQIVRRTFDRRICLRTQLESGLYIVGDHIEIQQVLMNLCVNARDAMESGGTLTLQLSTAGAGSTAPWAQIVVSDTGVGMDEKICAAIFEPFFTTKGHGSGLGLANAKEMIAVHGGAISVESMPLQGTSFQIQLPIAGLNGCGISTITSPPSVPVPPSRILLVDDDPLCRKAFSRLLSRAGHRVAAAESGHEALYHLEELNRPDVVLLDVDMPDMSGEETLRHMLTRDPSLRVLAVTGNRDAGRQKAMMDGGALHLLSKPFTSEALALALYVVLQGASPKRTQKTAYSD